MGFLRSKSKTAIDETEPQRRNRLSKPLTNRSQPNLRAPSRQDECRQNSSASSSQPSSNESLATSLGTESRVGTKHSSFSEEDRSRTALMTRNSPVKSGVAQLVARFESSQPGAKTSQQSLNKMRESTRSPLMANAHQAFAKQHARNGYTDSTEQLAAFRNSGAYRISPSESLDQLVDPFTIPSRRASRYKPGEATRQPELHTADIVSVEKLGDARLDKDDDALSFTTGEDTISKDSTIPSPEVRTGSPGNHDHMTLGNLSLGSLCVINGRASPAFSEVPKQIQIRRKIVPSRQVSSNYAASEAWEDETVRDDLDDIRSVSRYASTNYGRDFSFIAGAEARMMPRNAPSAFEQVTVPVPRTPVSKSRNQNAVSAEEYMAELPASPFAELESSSSEGSIRSTGSIVRHSVAGEVEDISLHNESVNFSSPPRNREVSGESRISAAESNPSMVESKLSSVDSHFARDEVFQSALEFQSVPPRSPNRPRPDTSHESTASDSGYGSKNSLSIVEMEMGRFEKLQTSVTTEEIHPVFRKETSPKKLGGFLPLRPALKSHATTPASSTTTTPGPPSTKTPNGSSAKSTTKTDETASQSSKFRKKLRKSRPNSFVGVPKLPMEIVVQRNISQEIFDVPAISPVAVANLGLRHQALPDLDRVVRNHNYSTNTSTTSLVQDIRFPSPNPEPEEGTYRSRKSRDRSRSRSKSRRRSFLSLFRTDKDSERRLSGGHQPAAELTIDHLGDVMSSLGSNPYDIAVSSISARDTEPHQRRSGEITPSNVSVRRQSRPTSGMESQRFQEPASTFIKTTHGSDGANERHRSRPRSIMMDDKTATEFARSRSRSIHKRDSWNERRSSMNDRPGLPGRTIRASSAADDAPPVPPIPHHEDLRPISWCYSQSPTSQNPDTLRSEEPAWLSGAPPEPEERPPPPPPPHSPQPSFLHDDDTYFHHEEEAFAPPPPSHSPRPMDLVPEPEVVAEDQWAAQARAWKARRQSAGERLKSRWSTNVELHHDPHAYQDNAVFGDDQTYPEIPSRPKSYYYEDVENHYQDRQDWDYQPEYDQNFIQRAQTWDETNHRPSYNYHVTHHYNHEVPENWPPQPVQQHHHQQTRYQGRGQHRQSYNDSNPNFNPSRPLSSTSRPHSRHSARSFASSLADELHPPDLQRRSPAPEFSRYSGGLGYGYEGRDKGFSGSAGTRNVSGRAGGAWKGTGMRRSWGVDLGDVPVMGVAVRV